jgi:putative heme-binding domain-containing protein
VILRELALAMNYVPAEQAVPMLVQLANKFDGEDRWYLEALGIGATGKEQELLAAWEKDGTNTKTKAGDLIRWRLRKDPPAQVRLNDRTTVVQEWWAAAPFDGAVGDPLGTSFGPDTSPAAISAEASFKGLDGKDVKWQRLEATPYESAVVGLKSVDFQKWCDANASRSTKVVGYFATTLSSPVDQSAKLLIGSDDFCKVWLNGKEVHKAEQHRAVRFAEDTVPVQLHAGANVLMIKLYQRSGTSGLLVAVEGEQQKIAAICDTLPGSESPTLASSNDSSSGPVTKDGQPLPGIEELAKLSGDAQAGEKVFASENGAKCIACHQIGTQGRMLGPPLTTIGQKLSKAQLFEAILKPNAGILMGYENWAVKTKKGAVISGLKTSDTADGVTIKDTDGKYHDIAAEDIARQVKQKISIMPENLSQGMTRKELVDLVEYLSTLRNKS